MFDKKKKIVQQMWPQNPLLHGQECKSRLLFSIQYNCRPPWGISNKIHKNLKRAAKQRKGFPYLRIAPFVLPHKTCRVTPKA